MSGLAEPRALTRRVRRAALAAIHAYQGARTGRPSPCRFWPTCSAYSAEAIEEHGLWRGGLLSARRLLRCRPFGRRGVDLVPARTTLREENA